MRNETVLYIPAIDWLRLAFYFQYLIKFSFLLYAYFVFVVFGSVFTARKGRLALPSLCLVSFCMDGATISNACQICFNANGLGEKAKPADESVMRMTFARQFVECKRLQLASNVEQTATDIKLVIFVGDNVGNSLHFVRLSRNSGDGDGCVPYTVSFTIHSIFNRDLNKHQITYEHCSTSAPLFPEKFP